MRNTWKPNAPVWVTSCKPMNRTKQSPEPVARDLPSLPDGVTQFHGSTRGEGRRVGIAAARFNQQLTSSLVTTAVDTLLEQGIAPEDVFVRWVPGSFELPLALQRLADETECQALIACGVVLQGKTLHAELIMRSLTESFQRLSLELRMPVIDAVVSAPSYELAEVRCLPGPQCRGTYAARTALECIG